MKRFCLKSTASGFLISLSILALWLTWGAGQLSVIGGCLIILLALGSSYVLWRDASASRKGEKDG